MAGPAAFFVFSFVLAYPSILAPCVHGFGLESAAPRLIKICDTARLSPPPKLDRKFYSGCQNVKDYLDFVHESDCLVWAKHTEGEKAPIRPSAFSRAGPVEKLHFDPQSTTANYAIVTCGGLCPGLNGIIHHVTETLIASYKIRGTVWGIRGGYHGFHDMNLTPMNLSEMWSAGDLVGLQHEPGCILECARGGFDVDKIIQFLDERDICQLYVVGGDGTLRGAAQIAEECMNRHMNVAIASIAKTIDNDVALVDRSFGFMTAVEASQLAVSAAVTEARSNLHGIGIVKLMGRSAGYIAASATLASGGDVDLCLIPEVEVTLRGQNGCLAHLAQRVRERGCGVVIVAEGAGEEILGQSSERDAGGNRKLPPIGLFIKEEIEKYFEEEGMPCVVKYIDPSYIVRAGKANAYDQMLTLQLSQNAVHGAFGGYTAFLTGVVNNVSGLISMNNRLTSLREYIPLTLLSK